MIALLAALAAAATVDRVVAVVNDDVIALSEVYELGTDYIGQKCGGVATPTCRREAEGEVLDALIARALIRQELARLQLDVTAEEIESAIDTMVMQYGATDRRQLEQMLLANGISWDTFREQITEQIREMKFADGVIRPRVTVTENELRDLYQRTARDYAGPPEAELEAFTIPLDPSLSPTEREQVLARAADLIAKVRSGERTWASVVEEVDPAGFAAGQGKMGVFKKGELAPSIDAVVFSTAAGELAGPLDLGAIALVVRVVGFQQSSGGVRPFEEIRGQLEQQLYQDKIAEATEQWVATQRRKVAITIRLDAPTPAP